MHRVLILLVGLLFIVVIIALAMSQSLFIAQHLARATNVSGPVAVRAPDHPNFQPLHNEALVAAGTILQTGPDGSVILSWIDGSRLVVGPDTLMTVLKCQVNRNTNAQTSLFRLTAGELLVRVRRLVAGQSKFEITTPTATAGVRGTIFSVEVTPEGQTEIAVLEGRVDFEAAGQSLAVTPGYQATTDNGQAKIKPLSSSERGRLMSSPNALGPYLRLKRPLAGDIAAPGLLTVVGEVEKGAQVTVNGKPARVNNLRRFRTQLEIPSGDARFTLRVAATDERGYVSEVVREVQIGNAK